MWSLLWRAPCTCEAWPVWICDMTRSQVKYVSFACIQAMCSNWWHHAADMYCSVLQCGAACCSILQRVVACCSALQCAVMCYSVLQCVAVRCSAHSVLLCVAICCRMLQYVVVCCSVSQCDWSTDICKVCLIPIHLQNITHPLASACMQALSVRVVHHSTPAMIWCDGSHKCNMPLPCVRQNSICVWGGGFHSKAP